MEVVRTDDSVCLWFFSEPIAAVNNATGLHTLLGGNAQAPELIGQQVMGVQYATDAPSGSAWDVVLANVDIVFVCRGISWSREVGWWRQEAGD